MADEVNRAISTSLDAAIRADIDCELALNRLAAATRQLETTDPMLDAMLRAAWLDVYQAVRMAAWLDGWARSREARWLSKALAAMQAVQP